MALATAAYAVSALVAGAVIARRGGIASGLLLGGSGVGAAAAAVTQEWTDATAADLTEVIFYVLIGLVLPLALATYPRPRRDRASRSILVVLVALGAIGILAGSGTALVLVYVTLLLDAWWAFECGDANTRRTLGWAWTGGGLALLAIALIGFVAGTFRASGVTDIGPLLPILALGLPLGMVAGVLPIEIVDVRALVTRCVVGSVVVAAFVAVLTATMAVAEWVGGKPVPLVVVVLGCALAAFAVHPLQVLLRGVVDEVLFGRRPDPLRAASGIATRMGAEPLDALAAVREGLLLPYVALEEAGEVLAESGTRITQVRPIPLGGGRDRRLLVGLRAGDFGLSSSDEQVLGVVAPLLAQTLVAQALTREVQASRGRVVGAVEDERRRLQRDLHDGLGPLLTGIAFTVDAVRNRMPTDPVGAERLLADLRAETGSAIGSVRRLVEGLRPPDLDQLGLAAALREHVRGRLTAEGEPLAATVDVETGPLPAAVEVAAYRIVVEATANVVRHTDAARIDVRVRRRGPLLLIEADDDGSDRSPWVPGIGLSSMAERAALVGGRLSAGPSATGGRVRAELPIPG